MSSPSAQLFAADLFHREYCVSSLREFGCTDAADTYERLPDMFAVFAANLWDHPRRDSVIPFRMNALQALWELRNVGMHPSLIFLDADWHKEQMKEILQKIFECV